ncbi:glycosyltransferase [Geothrix sp. PMB-07]|uniref:glycosyltransferase n=1 Tax=Geothrix sp. PMB-07 TaxID=3068640 RepID=UPI00274181F5|nr:glycosyltransferase [Geothrix sp. PMB-07]WLT31325.1 glycosyltransferase [Geothrix sp. PMB-07]
MIYDDIIAVIVSFNGHKKTDMTVRALLGKVGHIHIVDNGSDLKSLEVLRALEANQGVSVTYLKNNRGIGHALNLGLTYAKDGGFTWILTMDQDSLIDHDMVQAFCRAIQTHPDLACLSPTVIIHGEHKRDRRDGPISYAITSGNLVRMDVFERIGGYNEEMFIDALDFDFCLRARQAGWQVWQVGNAFLYHELGDTHTVPRPFSQFYTLHSPTRRYYMYRNFLYLAKAHARNFPLFIIKSAIAHFLLLITILLFEKERGSSLSAIFQGVEDFFHNRMGAKPEPVDKGR